MKTHVTSRAQRLTIIEKLLFRSAAGLRVVEIAKLCAVDRRTIYRDLALLEEIGVPLYQKDGRFFLNRDYYMATMRLNLHEAVSALLAVRVLAHVQDQENPHLVSLLRKLSEVLPGLPAEHTLTVAQRMALASPVDRAYVAIFEMVVRAWGERRMVKLWDGKQIYEFAVYLIEPLANGAIYVVGRDHLSQNLYAIKLRRIRRAVLLKAPYDIPAQFNVQRYLTQSSATVPGLPEVEETAMPSRDDEVQLLFAEAALEALQRDKTARASGHVQPTTDGRFLLRVRVADWHGLLPWVRSWGPLVEVVAPPELRQRVADDAAHITAVYSGA